MSRPELVIHGHFYQPPRENPWTEEVGRERSAAPAHDWNERITAESYRPNAIARIVDDDDHILAIIDNYEHISYNVGPTLMSWLEREQPDTYARIVEADKLGGGAIAQAFGHLIMPLASENDIRTQIRWGLADFRYRFGRASKGMWLPECAVNDTVLRILAEEGVGFTILAPGQAAAVRSLDGRHDWVGVEQSWLDTGHPYRWNHPDGDGKGVDIVFYNGPLSHALAFEMSSLDSNSLVGRMAAAGGRSGGIVTLATDGESFGHHHKHAERLLAHALTVEAPGRGLAHTNLNSVYERFRPSHEVRVHESAWSCAHGVGRWRDNCGCSTGGEAGWTQEWRAPLRAALNQLRENVDEVYTLRAPKLLIDPAAALDDYVKVVIGEQSHDDFARMYVRGNAVEAFTLLEMQRYAMSMFTSCGWFFTDLSGIETIQVLRYAARVIDLLEELDEPSPLHAFLAVLSQARSNVPGQGTGADLWRMAVEPARVNAARVVEHVALAEVLENKSIAWLGPYEVKVADRIHEQRGNLVLAAGVAELTHRRTSRRWTYSYAALRLGGLEVSGTQREVAGLHDSSGLDSLRTAFLDGSSVPVLLRELAELGDHDFDFSAAIPEAADRFMQDTADSLAERYMDAYERLYETHRPTMEDLALHGYELPTVLRAPAELALAHRFRTAVLGAELSTDPAAYTAAIAAARQARAAGFEVDNPSTTLLLERLVTDAVERAVVDPTTETVEVALDVFTLIKDLGVRVSLETAQESVYFATHGPKPVPSLEPLADVLRVRTTPFP